MHKGVSKGTLREDLRGLVHHKGMEALGQICLQGVEGVPCLKRDLAVRRDSHLRNGEVEKACEIMGKIGMLEEILSGRVVETVLNEMGR